VLVEYKEHPEQKPGLLRVGTVFSKANQDDFPPMAALLEPYQHVINTWKIYELVNAETQLDQRVPLLPEAGAFERELESLHGKTRLQILAASANSRDRAFFLVDPEGHVVVPEMQGIIMFDMRVGNLLHSPLEELRARWAEHAAGKNYADNHGLHYGKVGSS
jgi:hypothetical protein